MWVIIDRFTMMTHFIPVKTKATIDKLARMCLQEVWRLHELPSEIVSYRNASFDSKFLNSLMKLLDVDLKLSTTYHLQTHGQTERVNQTLEQYSRYYCFYQQDDWVNLLSLAEYAYNSATQESSKISLFYMKYEFKSDATWPLPKRKIDNLNTSSKVINSKWKTT
jgi:hypothetical protein